MEDDYEEKRGSHYGEVHAHREVVDDAGTVEAAFDAAALDTTDTCMAARPCTEKKDEKNLIGSQSTALT